MALKKEKKGRSKIFPGGSRTVKISMDVYKIIEKEAGTSGLYPSQIINTILRSHYQKQLSG